MPDRPRFYVTTPIYYVNDRPHLGHVYTTMVADVVARYHRLIGDETFFLTGVDEHAAKVSEKAAEMGLTPQAWADQNAAAFRDVFERLEITNDDFVRTSAAHHKQLFHGTCKRCSIRATSTRGLRRLVRRRPGGIRSRQQGPAKRLQIRGQRQAADSQDGKELLLPARIVSRTAIGRVRTARRRGVPFVQPDARKNEIVNRIKEMDDVPISRSGSGGWGIPVPGEEEQTIYVWIDALFNYLTFVDTDADSPWGDRRKFWQAGAVHFIAKDILWFHAAIWPALLLALQKCPGYEWVNLPRQVYSHSYWVSDSGQKMSKSLGNFLDPAAIDNYVSTFGLDALRYFLATRGPLGVSDSAFSPELFIEVYNSDLANTFGNCCRGWPI